MTEPREPTYQLGIGATDMTDNTQPEALRLADALERPGYGWHSTPAQCAAELRRLHAENAALQQGYAAARLEIQSLQARIKTMAEEHADELAVAHLDGRMRAAQPAGAQQPGAAYAALPYKQALGSTNCMQCCVSYMMGLPLENVPDFATDGGWERFSDFAETQGYVAVMLPGNREYEADYLASGTTARGTSHMVVMNDGKLVHDPHPSNAGLVDVQCVWLLAKRAPPTQGQQDEHTAFEASAKTYTSNVSFERDASDYVDMTASLLWHGWKLRASQGQAPAQAASVHPACKPDMLVNAGALKLALNVLRRAGKNEVADELEKTAQPSAVAGPVVNRATVIEWLDANDIEVTDRQMDGLFHSAAAPTTQPAPQQEAQEPVDSMGIPLICGKPLCSPGNHHPLCKLAAPPPSPQHLPASQGDALDAEQHEMDAKHAAIYRWMLSHVADVLSIFDNWFEDEEADTDELHDALAARAAQEGK